MMYFMKVYIPGSMIYILSFEWAFIDKYVMLLEHGLR